MTNFICLLYGAGDDCYKEAAYSLGTLRRRLDFATARIIVFTGRSAWDFERPIPYSQTKVHWLRKFGRCLS